MALTSGQRAVISWSGFAGACLFIVAAAKLDDERRQDAELERQRELWAAAQAGAVAATIINAVGDDLEAADCTDVLPLCPDPTRHEHAETAG